MAEDKKGALEIPKELMRPSNSWAVFHVGRTWLVILLGWWLCAVVPSWYAILFCALLTGLMQYHLSVLGHHSLHKNLFESTALNEVVARFLLVGPLGLPLGVTRANHMRHHNKFNEPEDYERPLYDLSIDDRRTPGKFLFWLGAQYLGGAALAAFHRIFLGQKDILEKKRRLRTGYSGAKDWSAVAVVQAVVFVLMWQITGQWWLYFVTWVLPIFTVVSGLSATRACLEHADVSDPPNRWITFPTNLIERNLLGPANFNFHAEHHIQSAVPACHLGKLHQSVLESPVRSELIIERGYFSRLAHLLRQMKREPA